MDFINLMRPMMIEPACKEDWILNVNQTLMFFSMVPRTTLNVVGARTVNGRPCTSSMLRVTVSVCVTASEKMLSPLLTFKGNPGGRIEREFPTYNPADFYGVQEKAWMDERVMQSYTADDPEGIRPLLLLDSYRCHQMASILQSTREAGVDVKHIPAGCTVLCQPIDVCIAKPLKDRVLHLWEDWLIIHGVTPRINPLCRQVLADWIVTALLPLDNTIVRNSWRHHRFSYYNDKAWIRFSMMMIKIMVRRPERMR